MLKVDERSRYFNRDFTEEIEWLISSVNRLSIDSPKDIQMKPVMGQPSTLTRTAITEKFHHALEFRKIRSLTLLLGIQNDTITQEN